MHHTNFSKIIQSISLNFSMTEHTRHIAGKRPQLIPITPIGIEKQKIKNDLYISIFKLRTILTFEILLFLIELIKVVVSKSKSSITCDN